MTDVLPFGWTAERQALFESAKRKEGTRCDLCQRFIKVYKRKINSSMARWLIQLVRRYSLESRWYGVGEPWSKQINARDICLFSHWAMTVMKPKDSDDTNRRTSGYWKPTRLGIGFALNEFTVPCYKFLYKNEYIFEEGPEVTIEHALGDDFDYVELMREGLS